MCGNCTGSTRASAQTPIVPVDSRLTFVTVGFEAEWTLLTLQARSMARFLNPTIVRELIVIDNGCRPLRPHERDRLRASYGTLASMVRILRPEDVTNVPECDGWTRQQILKLCVSALVSSELYVVLDAKNYLVAIPTLDYFRSPDGRPRVTAYPFLDHPLRPDLERVLAYFRLEPREHVPRFTSTITPFVMTTSLVREMIAEIESESGRPFAVEFVSNRLTEFFAYAAWLVARGCRLDETFELHQDACAVVWPSTATADGVRSAISRSTSSQCPFLGVHRRAYLKLDREGVSELATSWVKLGLFESTRSARRFVGAVRRALVREQVLRRVRAVRTR